MEASRVVPMPIQLGLKCEVSVNGHQKYGMYYLAVPTSRNQKNGIRDFAQNRSLPPSFIHTTPRKAWAWAGGSRHR